MSRYIDAEQLKDYIKQYWVISGHFMVSVLDNIDKIPTVDVQEVKHAHWISGFNGGKIGWDAEGKYVHGYAICSECGESLTASDEYECVGRFCPNCGAKMDEEDGKDAEVH